MEGTLHALALLAVIAISAAVCYRYGTRPHAVVPAFVITIVGALILCSASFGCVSVSHGTPPWDRALGLLLLTHHLPILASCLLLVIYFIPSKRGHWTGFLTLLMLGAAFTWHAARIYSLEKYTIIPRRIYSQSRPPDALWHHAITGFKQGDSSQLLYQAIQLYVVDAAEKRKYLPPEPPKREFDIPALSKAHDRIYSSLDSSLPIVWHGHLQGIGMLLLIALPLFLLIRYRRQFAPSQERVWRVVYAVALFVALLSFLLPVSNNTFALQWFIPAVCLSILIALFNIPRRYLIPYIIVTCCLSLFLSQHFIRLTDPHAGRYIYWTTTSNAAQLREMRSRLAGVASDDTKSYPAGWLKEADFWKNPVNRARPNWYYYPGSITWYTRTQPAWHSLFTSIFYDTGNTIAIWYPGGTLKGALPKIEFRPYTPPKRVPGG